MNVLNKAQVERRIAAEKAAEQTRAYANKAYDATSDVVVETASYLEEGVAVATTFLKTLFK